MKPAAERDPDAVLDRRPPMCRGCGAWLEAAQAVDYTARQVFDLPEPRPLLVTEHRAHLCCCPSCGTCTQASVPEGVAAPVQDGPRISAVATYVATVQFLPQDRLAAAMKDLFGVAIRVARRRTSN